MTTYELAKAMENELRSWRRELHRHPELGRNEHFAQEFSMRWGFPISAKLPPYWR